MVFLSKNNTSSFAALSEGLQNALTQLGGVPIEHRTDSLSAAFNNLIEEQALTRDYEGLCVHYNLKALRNNKGVSHENGAVETAHRLLKHRIEQALKLRAHNDFASIGEYQRFIEKNLNKLNAQSADQIAHALGLHLINQGVRVKAFSALNLLQQLHATKQALELINFMTVAAADRLIHHGWILQIEGENFRKKQKLGN